MTKRALKDWRIARQSFISTHGGSLRRLKALKEGIAHLLVSSRPDDGCHMHRNDRDLHELERLMRAEAALELDLFAGCPRAVFSSPRRRLTTSCQTGSRIDGARSSASNQTQLHPAFMPRKRVNYGDQPIPAVGPSLARARMPGATLSTTQGICAAFGNERSRRGYESVKQDSGHAVVKGVMDVGFDALVWVDEENKAATASTSWDTAVRAISATGQTPDPAASLFNLDLLYTFDVQAADLFGLDAFVWAG